MTPSFMSSSFSKISSSSSNSASIDGCKGAFCCSRVTTGIIGALVLVIEEEEDEDEKEEEEEEEEEDEETAACSEFGPRTRVPNKLAYP